MIYLLLAAILAGVTVSLGQAGLETASGATAASFGFAAAAGGFGLASNHGRGYGYTSNYDGGYGSPYSYLPQTLHTGSTGFSNVYIPGRTNPFVPFVRQSSSENLPHIKSGFIDLTPKTHYYQQYQQYINPTYPSIPYYSVPYFQSVETYKFYPSRVVTGSRKEGNLNFNPSLEKDTNNKTNQSLESTKNNETVQEDKSLNEPTLQLTYLGIVPPSSFRSIADSISVDDARRRIPFYILDYDDGTSGIARSSSSSPTVYLSPTRLLPTSRYPVASTQQATFTLPYGSSLHGIPTTGFSSSSPFQSRPLVSPYRSASFIDRPGYYLFDVNPLVEGNRGDSEPVLGSPRPTWPLIQTLTGPIGGPITEMLRPNSRGLGTSSQAQTGFSKQGENVNKVENQNFKTGYETQLPQGHAYTDFQSSKEVSVQKYDGRGQQAANAGFSTQSFGSPELEENLVKHLITV